MADPLPELERRIRGRPVPTVWVARGLHSMDHHDAQWFVDQVAAGTDPAQLFQSSIPYFALCSDEARVWYLPEMLAVVREDPFALTFFVQDLASPRGTALLRRLTLEERSLVDAFAASVPVDGVMQIAADGLLELRELLDQSRTIGSIQPP